VWQLGAAGSSFAYAQPVDLISVFQPNISAQHEATPEGTNGHNYVPMQDLPA
jgi:hypothetical protein